MFLGPWDAGAPWNPHGIEGLSRFFKGIWALCQVDMSKEITITNSKKAELLKKLHQPIKKTGDDIRLFRFNTSIATLMAFRNILKANIKFAGSSIWQECLENILLMLAPIAPHIAEELWQKIKPNSGSVHNQAWPKYNKSFLVEETVTIVVQVNGKVRDNLHVASVIERDEQKKLAMESMKVKYFLEGKNIQKVIVIPGRLVNIVCN